MFGWISSSGDIVVGIEEWGGSFSCCSDSLSTHIHHWNSHTLLRLIMMFPSVIITLYPTRLATVQIDQAKHVAHFSKTFVWTLWECHFIAAIKGFVYPSKGLVKAEHSSLLSWLCQLAAGPCTVELSHTQSFLVFHLQHETCPAAQFETDRLHQQNLVCCSIVPAFALVWILQLFWIDVWLY